MMSEGDEIRAGSGKIQRMYCLLIWVVGTWVGIIHLKSYAELCAPSHIMKINQTECLGHSVNLVPLKAPPGDITEQGQERVQGKQGSPQLELLVDMAVCAKY